MYILNIDPNKLAPQIIVAIIIIGTLVLAYNAVKEFRKK